MAKISASTNGDNTSVTVDFNRQTLLNVGKWGLMGLGVTFIVVKTPLKNLLPEQIKDLLGVSEDSGGEDSGGEDSGGEVTYTIDNANNIVDSNGNNVGSFDGNFNGNVNVFANQQPVGTLTVGGSDGNVFSTDDPNTPIGTYTPNSS